MNTVKLSGAICDGIDKICRDFAWSSNSEQRSSHLIKWDSLCQPKSKGGLGVKMTSAMNQAVLAKTGWRLKNEGSSLWAKMLKAKYSKGGDLIPHSMKNPQGSSTWRAINHSLSDLVENCIVRSIGNGKATKFWTKSWLNSGNLAIFLTNDDQRNEVVADYLCPNGWNVDKFKGCLPWRIVQEICGIYARSNSPAEDGFRWRFTTDGDFSVKSAYNHIIDQDNYVDWDWAFIWRPKVPPKILHFLWTFPHGRLMPNMQRARRHIIPDPNCKICDYYEENYNHILGDGFPAINLWAATNHKPQHFTTSRRIFHRWLKKNLQNHECRNGVRWSEKFPISLWHLWKWRNAAMFNPS